MSLRHIRHVETGLFQQGFGLVRDFLAMLHGTGGMIGHAQGLPDCGQVLGKQEFRNVQCVAADGLCLVSIGSVIAEHMTIVLDGGATSGGRDDQVIKILIRPLIN